MNNRAMKAFKELGPCDAARRWVAKQKNPSTAWKKCTNPAWMFWIVEALATPGVYTALYKAVARQGTVNTNSGCSCDSCKATSVPPALQVKIIREVLPTPSVQDIERAVRAQKQLNAGEITIGRYNQLLPWTTV